MGYPEDLRYTAEHEWLTAPRPAADGGAPTHKVGITDVAPDSLGDIVDAEAKATKFRAVMKELGAKREQTVAIGDGANDLKMMAESGVSVAFYAKPVVRAQASCAIFYGGLDAVINLFE